MAVIVGSASNTSLTPSGGVHSKVTGLPAGEVIVEMSTVKPRARVVSAGSAATMSCGGWAIVAKTESVQPAESFTLTQ